MDIFESLENLAVSEECFDDIMGLVEELIREDVHSAINKYAPEKDRERLHDKANRILQDELDFDTYREEDKSGRRTSGILGYTQSPDGKPHGSYDSRSPREAAEDRVIDRRFYNKGMKNDYNKHTSSSIANQREDDLMSGGSGEIDLGHPDRKEMNIRRGMVKHAKKLEKEAKQLGKK